MSTEIEIVEMPKSHYVSFCDKLREKTGSNTPIKSSELVEETETVFQAGYENGKSEGGTSKEEQEKTVDITENGTVEVDPDEDKVLSKVTVNVNVSSNDSFYDTFWDTFQQNGERDNYNYCFYGTGWDINNFKPKYNIKPIGTTEGMFRYTTNLNVDLAQLLDDLGVELDTSESTYLGYAFANSAITRCPTISFISTKILSNVFYRSSVVTIDKLVWHKNINCDSVFNECSSLKNITIEGEIGTTIRVNSSPLLTAESAKSIITHLVNYAGTDKEFTYSVLFADSVWELLDAEGATAPDNITWEEYVNSIGWNK